MSIERLTTKASSDAAQSGPYVLPQHKSMGAGPQGPLPDASKVSGSGSRTGS